MLQSENGGLHDNKNSTIETGNKKGKVGNAGGFILEQCKRN